MARTDSEKMRSQQHQSSDAISLIHAVACAVLRRFLEDLENGELKLTSSDALAWAEIISELRGNRETGREIKIEDIELLMPGDQLDTLISDIEKALAGPIEIVNTEEDIENELCEWLDYQGIAYERQKIIPLGRIDVFVHGSPPMIIEVKSAVDNERIKRAIGQLVLYSTCYPDARLCIYAAQPIPGDLLPILERHGIADWHQIAPEVSSDESNGRDNQLGDD